MDTGNNYLLDLPRKEVSSSNIKAIARDDLSNTLVVEFHNGAIYSYKPVTSEGYKTLLFSPSIGKTFIEEIRYNPIITSERLV